jgi:hypothetical protein
MRIFIKIVVAFVRLAARTVVVAVAAAFWVMRVSFHAMLIGRGATRLLHRRTADGSVQCSSCGELIGPEAALECTSCKFRWWGSLWAPCPGPDCAGRTTSWVICPHCNYSSTNPYLVGRELPE